VRNADARSGDYQEIRRAFRPSHADYTTQAKYGVRAQPQVAAGASARETIGRVASGAIARKLLAEQAQIEIVGYVKQVCDPGGHGGRQQGHAPGCGRNHRALPGYGGRRPDDRTCRSGPRRRRFSGRRGRGGGAPRSRRVGGAGVRTSCTQTLAKPCCRSRPARGFEVGSGFAGARLRGSEHNDIFFAENGRIRTRTNRSGGIQGGISNGEDIIVRAAFKPVATILREQETVDVEGNSTLLKPRGRHDPCVLPRAVPIVRGHDGPGAGGSLPAPAGFGGIA